MMCTLYKLLVGVVWSFVMMCTLYKLLVGEVVGGFMSQQLGNEVERQGKANKSTYVYFLRKQ